MNSMHKPHALNFRASSDLMDKLTDLRMELQKDVMHPTGRITLTDVIASAIHDMWIVKVARGVMSGGIEELPIAPDTHVGIAKKKRPGATVKERLRKRPHKGSTPPAQIVVKVKRPRKAADRNGK